MEHRLKTIQPYFDRVKIGDKTAEFRLNDRDFQVGDILILEEYDPKTSSYSSHSIKAKVSHVLREFKGIESGYCMLSLTDIEF